MKKQTKKFWVSYILFTIILSFSLYKITAKQINYREIESQEIDIRKLASIIEIKDMNDNTEIINPPEENIEPEEPDINIPPNDYWYYINIPLISVDFNSLIAKNNDTGIRTAWLSAICRRRTG